MKIKSKIAKLVAIGILATSIMGCDAPTIAVNGNTYRDYGIINQNQNYDPSIDYEPDWWNICLGVIFFESIIVPIYVFGFHFMEPVGVKNTSKGV